jgi:hypothetical protein
VTSVYDPSVSSTKTLTVLATPVVTSVQVFRPDGQVVTANVYRGTAALPDKNLVVFTGQAVGVNVSGPFATDSVNWTIVSGPGALVGASIIDSPFPGIGGSSAYSVGYIGPVGFPLTAVPVTLRATSFEDPSKFTDVTFNLLGDPSGSVVTGISVLPNYPASQVPATTPASVDTNYWMPGTASQRTNVRRSTVIKTSTAGSGLGYALGSTLSVVSGASIASLTAIPVGGSQTDKYYNLIRNGNQSGWVVVRATSVHDPSKFKESGYYFRPQVFSIMALTQFAGPILNPVSPFDKANVLRIYNGGALTEPVTITSVNCTVAPSIEPQFGPFAEPDVNGRAITFSRIQ